MKLKGIETPEALKALDHKIEGILRDLRTVKFKTKTDPGALKVADQIQQGSRAAKNVYMLGEKWVVKYYFAAKQRSVAFFEAADYDLAYRLADILIRRFSGLRIRLSPLTEDSYNLTSTQLEHDLSNEPDINSAILQLLSVIPDREPSRRAPHRTAKQGVQELSKKMDLILQRMERIEKLLEKPKSNSAALIGHWDLIEKSKPNE